MKIPREPDLICSSMQIVKFQIQNTQSQLEDKPYVEDNELTFTVEKDLDHNQDLHLISSQKTTQVSVEDREELAKLVPSSKKRLKAHKNVIVKMHFVAFRKNSILRP